MIKTLHYVVPAVVFCSDICPGHGISVPLCIRLSYLCGVVCYEPISKDKIYFPITWVENAIDWGAIESDLKQNPVVAACRLERRPLRESFEGEEF